MVCEICGKKPATCFGSYEGQPESFACDDCCGHGNEDGFCVPVLDLSAAERQETHDSSHS